MLIQPDHADEINNPLNHNRLFELDALRGLAAVFVVLFHYSLNGRPTYHIFRFGITGVDLFFIISGFVIMMSIERIKYGYEFIISRFCRLFPTYWTCVTLALIIIMIAKPYYGHPVIVPWGQYFANLTMFQQYLGYDNLDGPFWTMIVELLFYFVMLLLFYTKALRSVILILIMLVSLITLLTEKYNGDSFTQDFIYKFPLIEYIPLFVAGILFYKLFTRERKTWLLILLILGCYFSQVLLYRHCGRAHGHVSHPEYKLILGIYFTFFFLLLFRKLKFIVNRYTLFLGKISFALYLIHQYLSINLIIPYLVDNGTNYYVASLAIALPVSLLFATAITFWVEIPAGKWLKPRLYKTAHFIVHARLKLAEKLNLKSGKAAES
jgi:peptidoglycan/LPS O-acetylase OafA/YrhL